MLELYQTAWCPVPRRVRERLTELGLDCVVHQVPVEREERTTLLATTGGHTIPARCSTRPGPRECPGDEPQADLP
jgi:Glutathione S-transferase, N-terminal domain